MGRCVARGLQSTREQYAVFVYCTNTTMQTYTQWHKHGHVHHICMSGNLYIYKVKPEPVSTTEVPKKSAEDNSAC